MPDKICFVSYVNYFFLSISTFNLRVGPNVYYYVYVFILKLSLRLPVSYTYCYDYSVGPTLLFTLVLERKVSLASLRNGQSACFVYSAWVSDVQEKDEKSSVCRDVVR